MSVAEKQTWLWSGSGNLILRHNWLNPCPLYPDLCTRIAQTTANLQVNTDAMLVTLPDNRTQFLQYKMPDGPTFLSYLQPPENHPLSSSTVISDPSLPALSCEPLTVSSSSVVETVTLILSFL